VIAGEAPANNQPRHNDQPTKDQSTCLTSSSWTYLSPHAPMQGSAAQGAGDDTMWSPMSSTLIHGASEAVLVDTLVTNDQVDALVGWIEGFDVNLTTIYITHGHADHWIGLARLLQRFPMHADSPHPRLSAAPTSRPRTRRWPPTGRAYSQARCRRPRLSLRS
jgi:glyoxylase-like metal-dependent hydrolase (beta-lactamase superfamily II)